MSVTSAVPGLLLFRARRYRRARGGLVLVLVRRGRVVLRVRRRIIASDRNVKSVRAGYRASKYANEYPHTTQHEFRPAVLARAPASAHCGSRPRRSP